MKCTKECFTLELYYPRWEYKKLMDYATNDRLLFHHAVYSEILHCLSLCFFRDANGTIRRDLPYTHSGDLSRIEKVSVVKSIIY